MELGRDFAFTARAKMNYAYFSRLSSKKLWNCGTTVVEISFSFSPSIMWHSPLFLLLLLLLFWRQRRRRKIATHSFQNGSSCALKWILTVLDTERVKNNFISVTYFVGNPRECFGGGGGGGGNIRCAPALFHLRWENRLVFFLSFVGETAWNAGRVGRELSSDSDADADQDEDEDADDDDNDDDFQPFSSSVFGSACLFPFS